MVKIPKHTAAPPDFDAMMRQADSQIEEKQAEQEITDRVPQLRQLHTDIDQATTTFINATLQLESAIRKYNHAEINLNAAVKDIGTKVNTINTHLDTAIKNAPDKLKVTIHASDADMQHIQEQFDKHRAWVIGQMAKNLREVNDMLLKERKHADYRYRETEGIYFGHRMQWFFLFFFVFGITVFLLVIVMMILKYYGKL